jgi:uncharacterized membrane protein YhhN
MLNEKKKKVFYVFFALIALGDLTGRIYDSQTMDFLFKPLLMPCLMILLYVSRRKKGLDSFVIGILAGQFFSWLGDIALMFGGEGTPFLAGLGSFFAAHIAYTFVFWRSSTDKEFEGKPFLRRKMWLILPFLVYFIGLYSFLYPSLREMTIPVFAYAFMITLMSLSALNRYGRSNSVSFKQIFIGSVLFVISDSILAYTLFAGSLPFSGVFVMLTYIAAQLLIAEGSINKNDE